MISYTILGTPVAILKSSHVARKTMDDFNLNRFHHQTQLREQHDEKPLITGLWNMEVEFHFDRDFVKSRGYAPNKPAISSLLKYLDDVLHGIIYENEYVIAHIIATKFYDRPQSQTTIRLYKAKERDGKKDT